VVGIGKILVCASLALGATAGAQRIAVTHVQKPMHRYMVARTADGKVIANGEFTQTTQGDEVTMRLLYKFLDGSVDDETTTYTQRDKFRLVRNHHIERGPFFSHPSDFTIEAATGTVTSRTMDSYGKAHDASSHIDLPDDLANGFVGTLLLNVSPKSAPFRVSLLAPVRSGRLIRILISPDSEQQFQMDGKTLKAAVFRIHPELGGIVGMIAPLIGLQPKDVMVWVLEGDDPAVVRIVGQLGGYGPVVSSELVGAGFGK
jgi:hypothetical protein